MARYSAKTKLSPERALQEAILFFGPDGAGLEVTEQSSSGVTFTGGGGHIAIEVLGRDGGSTLEFESREWDYEVRRFMERL